MKKGIKELKNKQINNLANKLRNHLIEKPIPIKWTQKSQVNHKEFMDYYEFRLNQLFDEEIYKSHIFPFFQKSIRFVHDLMIGKQIISNLKNKFKIEIAKDLTNEYGFSLRHYRKGSFLYYLTIFSSKYIYECLKRIKIKLIKDEKLFQEILKLVWTEFSSNPLKNEWLNLINQRNQFKKKYDLFQIELHWNQIYRESFLNYVRKLINIIFILLNNNIDFSNLHGIRKDIAENLIQNKFLEEQKKLPIIFKNNLLIVLSRIIFTHISTKAQSNNLKVHQLKLTTNSINNIANNLIKNLSSEEKIGKEFLADLYKISTIKFEQFYQQFQTLLRKDKIFEKRFEKNLQQLIERVYGIVSGEYYSTKNSVIDRYLIVDLLSLNNNKFLKKKIKKIHHIIIKKLKIDFSSHLEKNNNPENVSYSDLAIIIDGISLTQIKKFNTSTKLLRYSTYLEFYYFIKNAYEKNIKNIEKWTEIESYFSQLFMILSNNTKKLPTEEELNNYFYRDLEKKSWELWFDVPWSKYSEAHPFIKRYWCRRCNKIASILIKYCQKYNNIPVKIYVLKNKETIWRELKALKSLENIDLEDLEKSFSNYNIDLNTDIISIRLLYRRYQFKHIIENNAFYNTKEFLNDIFNNLNNMVKNGLIKNKIELKIGNQIKKINVIYQKKVTQYVLSILMGQKKTYIQKTIKFSLRFNKFYVIDYEPLKTLLENINMIFRNKNEEKNNNNISIEKIKTIILNYMETNKWFYTAKKKHVLQYHPNLSINYFDKIFDDSANLIERIEAAYWLGFIFADGYITRKNEFGINLSIKDKSMLYKFCLATGANPTYIRDVITDKKDGKDYYASVLRIYNAEFCKFLRKHGVIKQKSNILKLPEQFQNIDKDDDIMKKIFLAFLLGYFDGDGIENGNMIISGSSFFLEEIKKTLNITFNLKSKKIIREISANAYYFNINKEIKKKMEDLFEKSMARKRRYVEGIYYDELIDPQINKLILDYIDSVHIEDIKKIINKYLEKHNILKDFKLSLKKLSELIKYNNLPIHGFEWYTSRGLNLNKHKNAFLKAFLNLIESWEIIIKKF